MSWMPILALSWPKSHFDHWSWNCWPVLRGALADDVARTGGNNAGEIARFVRELGFVGTVGIGVVIIAGAIAAAWLIDSLHQPVTRNRTGTEKPLTVQPIIAAVPGNNEDITSNRNTPTSISNDASAAGQSPVVPSTMMRALSASMPAVVKQRETAELHYALSGANIMVTGTNFETAVFEVAPAPNATGVKLTIRLHAPAFDVVNPASMKVTRAKGANRKTHRVDLRKPDEIIEERFLLTPRNDAVCDEDTEVLLEVEQDQARIAALKLKTRVVAVDAPGSAAVSSSVASATLAPRNGMDWDLRFEIKSTDQNKTYRIAVTGAIPDANGGEPHTFDNQLLGRITFRDDAGAKARDMLRGFRDIDAEEDLEGKRGFAESCGTRYWRILPAEFQDFYWKEMHGKNLALLIDSDEPYIAWELVTPEKPGVMGEMLGLVFSIAHWGPSSILVSTLFVNDFVTISPRKGDKAALKSALEEVTFLNKTYGARTVTADIASVRKVIQGSGPQIVHFGGHGVAGWLNPQDSAIKLEGDRTFRSNELRVLAEDQKRLLILNGCETGILADGLAGKGGWAQSAMETGYVGFIGSYWNITDEVAKEAAQVLYQELAAGATIGFALMMVRRQFIVHDTLAGRASWLAYTLHCCRPNMGVVFEISEIGMAQIPGAGEIGAVRMEEV